MNLKKILWLPVVVMLLFIGGCGNDNVEMVTPTPTPLVLPQ